ncbi:MAG: efflux RND transporter permease subunit [Pseudomonadota bacterium]
MSGPSDADNGLGSVAQRLRAGLNKRGPRGNLVSIFLRHPNAANLVMALMVLAGIYGLISLNTQFFPDIENKAATISIGWSGASADDVSTNILAVVEPEVRFIDGITEVVSYAREGSGTVALEFSDDTDMTQARADIEQALDSINLLPDGADTPSISTPNFSDRVGQIALSGPFSEGALKSFARDLRDRLIDGGVDSVDFSGVRDTEFEVTIDPATLRRLDLSLSDVASRISQNSRDLPSGNLDGDLERQLRTLGEAETLQTLGRIVVRGETNGERVELRDIARIEESFEDGQTQGFVGGDRAIRLDVFRSKTSDVLEVAQALTTTVDQARNEYPQSLDIRVFNLSSTAVEQRIQLLVNNGLTGLVVVIAILMVFLNFRVAFWVAVGIPTAVMATLGLMYLFGQSINMLSLFALIMTLGIIVDDAIVVGEHTATRLDMGEEPFTAAENGALRMMAPVIAAMLTTTAAFGPLLLIGDNIGQIMSPLPVVVVAVLIASLIEVFFVLPGHLAHSLGAPKRQGISWVRLILTALIISAPIMLLAYQPTLAGAVGLGELSAAVNTHPLAQTPALVLAISLIALITAGLLEFWRMRREAKSNQLSVSEQLQQKNLFRRGFDGGFNWFRDNPFRLLVKTAVSWRYVTLSLCVACLLVVVGVLRGNHVGFVFFPSPEAESISASITFTPGVSEDAALTGLMMVQEALVATDATLSADLPNEDTLIRSIYASYGTAGRNRGDNFASIDVQLTSSEERSIRTPEFVRAWRRTVPDIAGVDRLAIFERRGGPPGRDLDIRLHGDDVSVLKAAGADLQTVLSSFPGVSGVDDDLPYGKPELILSLTPRGQAMGFTLDGVGIQIRDAVAGRIALEMPRENEQIAIRVRQEIGDGGSGSLRSLELRSPSGIFVPLTEVVMLEERQGFSVIQRRDGRTTISVTADVDPEITNNGEIEAVLRSDQLERISGQYGIDFSFSGRAEERQGAFADLRIGTVIALGIMYIILAWVFASYWRPIAVMMIIPFGIVGAIFGHWIMGFQLTILSLIGLLGLAGILVNNSIILVSRFDERLKEGLSVTDAAVQATQDRFRAILLTSLTTVGGLSPLLFETSLQAQFLLPMAITITFGLATATVFVLFLVPSLLKVGEDTSRVLKAFFGRRLVSEELSPAE